jgi:hypothetical protein
MIPISNSLIHRISRGKQHEGDDEDRPDQVDDHAGIDRRERRRLERDEHDERVLEDIVVPGAEELRPEKRREAALLQEVELVGRVHASCLEEML